MKDVFVVADNIVSPLGATTEENFLRLRNGVTAVRRQDRPEMADQPFFAALFDPGDIIAEDGFTRSEKRFTRFEKLLSASIGQVLKTSGIDPSDPRTILILSSTKGNISLLESGTEDPERIALTTSARLIARQFQFTNTPLIVSNACISGILALVTAMRLIRSGRYDTAVVAGSDVISKFVLSGFGSFQAISPGHCKPFDRLRDGINLGEGAATVVLSGKTAYQGGLRIRGGSVGNDANHISGPSRTGEELAQVIKRSMTDAACSAADIDFISAHGTATVYNDEMEARAITLAELRSVPVNSLKGYYGHTLGAAGLIESIVTLQSMREDLVLPSRGFETNGVTTPLNVCTSLLRTPLDHCLKTASGFGGCNAAVVISK
jgi:3-oxoacyl-[acyl-carrier-protein] synthase-1